MRRTTLTRFVAITALAASTAGCGAIAGAVPKGGPIAQSLAEEYARMGSGASGAPVSVVSSRLSTYGAEHPGGTAASPDTQVWAVVLSGLFFPGTPCFVPLPAYTFAFGGTPAPLAPRPEPCPTAAQRERILLDAHSGTRLEALPG